jgi:hypothetical protein
MRYLPTSPIEGFWETLYFLVQDCLLVKTVLMSREGNLKRSSDIRVLPPIFKHEEEPLFPDTADDVYLAAEYGESDVEILRNLDVIDLTEMEMVDRLERDVLYNPTTHLRGTYQDEYWHSSFATLAEHLMHDCAAWKRVMKLPIIPLNNGDWVSPQSLDRSPVYLPYLIDDDSVKIQIPDNLGLRKLHPRSCTESEGSSFYAAIGISSCSKDLVIGKILESHKRRALKGTLRDAVAHLEILFWYCDSLSFLEFSWNEPQLWASDRNNSWQLTSTLFFRSEEPYHADKLLENTSPEEFSGFGFLADVYMKSNVQYSLRGQMTWKGFLERIGVRYYPNLVKGRFALNPVLTLVARDNPGKFVANLQAHWTESYAMDARRLKDTLKETLILCRNGQRMPLKKTLLPTCDLLTKSDGLGVQSSLPFMKLPDDTLVKGEEEWKFLRVFDAICEPDLNFYFTVLETLSRIDKTQLLDEGPGGEIKRVYTTIYKDIARISKLGDDEKLKVCSLHNTPDEAYPFSEEVHGYAVYLHTQFTSKMVHSRPMCLEWTVGSTRNIHPPQYLWCQPRSRKTVRYSPEY